MKHIIAKLIAFALLGALMTMALAWGIVVWAPQIPSSAFGSEDDHHRLLGREHPETIRLWTQLAPPEWQSATQRAGHREFGFCRHRTYLTALPPTPGQVNHFIAVSEAQVGWPCRSLTSVLLIERKNSQQTVVVKDGWRVQPASGKILPYRPIWPGFALSTLFYGALIGGAFEAWPAVRARRRKQHGHCKTCGYDLRHVEHDVCPECGSGSVEQR